MLWTNRSKEIDNLLQDIQTKIYVNPSLVGAKKTIEDCYLAGINEEKRLEHVQNRYTSLKHEIQDIVNEFENMFHGPRSALDKFGMQRRLPNWINEHDDKSSVSISPYVLQFLHVRNP